MKLLNQWINFTLHSVDINCKDTFWNCKNMRNQRKQNCYNGTLQNPAVLHERITTTYNQIKSQYSSRVNQWDTRTLDTTHFVASLCSTKTNLSFIPTNNKQLSHVVNTNWNLRSELFLLHLFWPVVGTYVVFRLELHNKCLNFSTCFVVFFGFSLNSLEMNLIWRPMK